MQEKMRKLVEESTKRKKEKKKQKQKEKNKKSTQALPNSSSNNSMGKPGAHGALSKTNSIVDSVDDSIASVVSGADLKIAGGGGGDVHNNPSSASTNKSLNMHHNMAPTAGNAAKMPKSKGEIVKQNALKNYYYYFIYLNFTINQHFMNLFYFFVVVFMHDSVNAIIIFCSSNKKNIEQIPKIITIFP